MATWAEMSRESIDAAKLLLDHAMYRSCVNRAYYAAYAAAVGELTQVKIVQFGQNRQNPGHEQLAQLIKRNLADDRFHQMSRRQVVAALRSLRRGRESADYRPGMTVNRAAARYLLGQSLMVMRAMGVTP